VPARSQDLTLRDRGVLCTSAVVVLCALMLPGRQADAQLLRGTVRLRDTAIVIDRARVVAEDRRGRTLGSAVTDDEGRYRLTITASDSTPFRLNVTRIGMQPSLSDEYRLAVSDTVTADLFVRELPLTLEQVDATAAPSVNMIRFAEAKRRGWRVYDPETIRARSASSNSLNDLLRSLGAPGLLVPQRAGECIKTTRTGQCLAIIIDNVLVSGGVHLNPREIYFLAVVGSSDSRLEWGDRAGYGAIAIYTRMAGDPLRP
jgi:hypothetical protein